VHFTSAVNPGARTSVFERTSFHLRCATFKQIVFLNHKGVFLLGVLQSELRFLVKFTDLSSLTLKPFFVQFDNMFLPQDAVTVLNAVQGEKKTMELKNSQPPLPLLAFGEN